MDHAELLGRLFPSGVVLLDQAIRWVANNQSFDSRTYEALTASAWAILSEDVNSGSLRAYHRSPEAGREPVASLNAGMFEFDPVEEILNENILDTMPDQPLPFDHSCNKPVLDEIYIPLDPFLARYPISQPLILHFAEYGWISPEIAESWLHQLTGKLVGSVARADELEGVWSLAMAINWIRLRNLQKVRETELREKMSNTAWIAVDPLQRDRRREIKASAAEGWRAKPAETPSIYDEAVLGAEMAGGEILNAEMARRELFDELRQGNGLIASAVQMPGASVHTVPANEWAHLRATKGPDGSDQFVIEGGADDRRYQRVTVRSADVRRIWNADRTAAEAQRSTKLEIIRDLDVVRKAARVVYEKAEKPPNVVDGVKMVQEQLAKSGLKSNTKTIRNVFDEQEFKNQRSGAGRPSSATRG